MQNPDRNAARSARSRRWALGLTLAAGLAAVALWRSDDVPAAPVAEVAHGAATREAVASDAAARRRSVPRAQGCSAAMAIVADPALDVGERLRAFAGIPHPAGVGDRAALLAILLDPDDDDTIRNEAANGLRAYADPKLVPTLLTVLRAPREGERMRAFAAQHLGVAWEDMAPDDPGSAPLRAELRALLAHGDAAVRREALLALSRRADAVACSEAERLIADPGASGMHDLCVRVLSQAGRRDLLPRFRELADATDVTVRIAAVAAIGALGDPDGRQLCATAAASWDPAVRSAGELALRRLGAAP